MKRKKLIRMTAHSETLALLKGQIGFLAKEMDIILVAKDVGNLKSLAEQEGVDYRDVDMHREISILNDIRSLFRLIVLFHRENPDIVHANTPKGALLGLMAAWITRVPNRIYNVNGLRFETTTGALRRLLIAMEKVACACATKVIPQSNGVADIVIQEHITKKLLKVIHNGSGNGVDVEYFNPHLPQLKSQAEDIRGAFSGVVFVFVGRLVGDKGVNELVAAFKKLSKEYDNTRLYLIGGKEENLDPLREETIIEIQNNPKILDVGKQNDVRPYLAASDVFILPSYREGFPNVVLEAAAMGLPCVVSDVNGATDAIQNGINGIIVPKRDVDALYEAMRQLTVDKEMRRSMAAVARNMIIERFNRYDVWRETIKMYQDL